MCVSHCKFIDCNSIEQIRKKVITLVPEHPPSSLFYIDNNKETFLSIDEIDYFFKELGWTKYIRAFAFNIVSGKKVSTIHVDTGESGYSFNFPIQNCSGSIINFYKNISGPVIKEYRSYNTTVTYKHFYTEQCEKIESTTIGDRPYLMKIHVPHNIENHATESRITLLTRFNKEFDAIYGRG
jgi:hypothetical protein